MIGQAPIGLAFVGGWLQTAGVTLPAFSCPAHRIIRLEQAQRFIAADQLRFVSTESQSRYVRA